MPALGLGWTALDKCLGEVVQMDEGEARKLGRQKDSFEETVGKRETLELLHTHFGAEGQGGVSVGRPSSGEVERAVKNLVKPKYCL